MASTITTVGRLTETRCTDVTLVKADGDYAAAAFDRALIDACIQAGQPIGRNSGGWPQPVASNRKLCTNREWCPESLVDPGTLSVRDGQKH